jgi:hypothetical protein
MSVNGRNNNSFKLTDMKKETSNCSGLLVKVAIACHLIFVLWIMFNGSNERFEGTLPEKVSYILLKGL